MEKRQNNRNTTQNYKKLLQNKAINVLSCINDKMLIDNKLKGTKEVTINDVKITINGNEATKLSTRTNQIFDYLLLILTETLPHGNNIKLETINEKREIAVSLLDFMEQFGLKSKSQARTQLTKAIKNLYNISLEWSEDRHIKEKGKKKLQRFDFSSRILNTIGINGSDKIIKNNVAMIKFDIDFAKAMTIAPVMTYDTRLLKLNPKSSSYDFAKALLYFHNINYFKANKGIISVKNLLIRSPKIPKYKDISKQGMISRSIIEPFENALIELEKEGIITEWTYKKPKGELLTDQELEKMKYQDWVNWNVHFKINIQRKRVTRKSTAEGQKKENL